ncbi:MAG: multicopper oxidase domain-containing protein [Geodermatophilaceae bacterium]|nr:multicopper oxidase domain-containing protein [Geodermatophilaceae bacterium]
MAGCGSRAAGSGQTAELLTSSLALPRRFTVALPIPTVKQPSGSADGADLYEIVQREADLEIVPGFQTPVFGYDGSFPGPTILSRRGRPIRVRHTNRLPVPTVVHLHGGHTPAESDGYPVDLLLPEGGVQLRGDAAHDMGGDVRAGSRVHSYPMDQLAATLWYHDHRMDFTAPQVWRGLAGFHLVHDEEEEGLGLPSGERDVPLMICDRAFQSDGQFRYPAIDPTMLERRGVQEDYMEGVLGDVILVNGAPWPMLEVDAARYRLRILNASNARRYDLRLDPAPNRGPGFVQIGSDGGLLAAPIEHASITVAAAERFDVVVDFGTYPVGSEVTLRNALGSGSTADVMRFRVVRTATDDSQLPEKLTELERLAPADAQIHREWSFSRGAVGEHAGWTINGLAFDPDRMDAEVKLGEVEIWRFFTDLHHPVHVHLNSFQVVGRNGGDPGPFDAGWKDTVDIRPAEYVDVAVRFSDHAGKFLMHCHNLEHEDMAMMSAFRTR